MFLKRQKCLQPWRKCCKAVERHPNRVDFRRLLKGFFHAQAKLHTDSNKSYDSAHQIADDNDNDDDVDDKLVTAKSNRQRLLEQQAALLEKARNVTINANATGNDDENVNEDGIQFAEEILNSMVVSYMPPITY